MDASTPIFVGSTMLGIVASVLAVVCKWMQQLPTLLGHAVHRWKDTTHKTLCTPRRPCVHVMRLRGPNNAGRAVQMDPTLLRYASAIMEQKNCWELLAQKFDRFQTLHNNFQQHVTICNRVCKRTQHVTSNNVASVCTGLTVISISLFFSVTMVIVLHFYSLYFICLFSFKLI